MGHECKRGLFGRGESAIGGGEEDGVLKGWRGRKYILYAFYNIYEDSKWNPPNTDKVGRSKND
jgi:hypothetical protein